MWRLKFGVSHMPLAPDELNSLGISRTDAHDFAGTPQNFARTPQDVRLAPQNFGAAASTLAPFHGSPER